MRPPSNILVIRFSSLGDIVLTSPVLRFLREHFPGARIDFLTKKRYAELVQWNGALSNVILFDEASGDDLKMLRRRIRETRYDLILDLHNSLRSIYLRTFARARRVMVFRKHALKRFLLVKFRWNLYDRVSPVVERYADTVRNFGDPDLRVDFPLPEDVVGTARARLHAGKLSDRDRIVGMAPSARHFTKRWPMEKFVKLGIALASEERVKIAVFGSADEAEYCEDIAHLVNAAGSSHYAESFAGKLTLTETAAASGLCELFISNDTGLMHLAAARGAPVLAIFGSSVKEFGFAPQGDRSVVVENKGLACRPCSHVGRPKCPKEHFRCMNDIAVDPVLSAARAVLRDRAGAHNIA